MSLFFLQNKKAATTGRSQGECLPDHSGPFVGYRGDLYKLS
jgi:hypothetical protein